MGGTKVLPTTPINNRFIIYNLELYSQIYTQIKVVRSPNNSLHNNYLIR